MSTGLIELKYYGVIPVEHMLSDKAVPIYVEPPVGFSAVSGHEYKQSGGWDFIYLAQSPEYTSEATDRLIEIISSYIDENKSFDL